LVLSYKLTFISCRLCNTNGAFPPYKKLPKSFHYISHYPNVCKVPRHEIGLTSFGLVPNKKKFKKNKIVSSAVSSRPFTFPEQMNRYSLASFTKLRRHITIVAEIGQKQPAVFTQNCNVSVHIRGVKLYTIICEFSYIGIRKILRRDFVTCTQACVLCAEQVQFFTLHCTFGKIKSHHQGGEFRFRHSYFLRIGKCSLLRRTGRIDSTAIIFTKYFIQKYEICFLGR